MLVLNNATYLQQELSHIYIYIIVFLFIYYLLIYLLDETVGIAFFKISTRRNMGMFPLLQLCNHMCSAPEWTFCHVHFSHSDWSLKCWVLVCSIEMRSRLHAVTSYTFIVSFWVEGRFWTSVKENLKNFFLPETGKKKKMKWSIWFFFMWAVKLWLKVTVQGMCYYRVKEYKTFVLWQVVWKIIDDGG